MTDTKLLQNRMDLWAEVMRRARLAGFSGSQKTLDNLRREAAREIKIEFFAFSDACVDGREIDRIEHYEKMMPTHLKPYLEAVFCRPGEFAPITTEIDAPIEDWIHGKV